VVLGDEALGFFFFLVMFTLATNVGMIIHIDSFDLYYIRSEEQKEGSLREEG
jgi:hypothetical protein